MDNLGRELDTEQLVNATLEVDASIPRRIAAFIIDLLFINIFLAAPFSTIITANVDGVIPTAIPNQLYLAIGAIATVALLYFALCESYEQQTLGMMVVNIYVTPQPSILNGILRNLYIYPFFPFNLLWIIEPIHLYLTGHRILERLTGTKTVTANE